MLTLALHKKMTDKLPEESREDGIKAASSAISAHVVTLIQKLGRKLR